MPKPKRIANDRPADAIVESTDAPLLIEYWPITRPVPYPNNARKLSDRAVDVLAASIRDFGFRQPIVVDEHDVIIAGHTRLLAAKKLELAVVPIHVATGLTPAQVKAYRLADNRTADETSWDMDLLETELVELKDLEINLDLKGLTGLTGFDPIEIEEITKPTPAAQEDDVPAVLVTAPVSKAGDLWLLGPHRVLCGDSTSTGDTQRLCGPDKADMVFTDPPYNVDYDPEDRPHAGFSAERKANPLGKIKNDNKSPEAFRAFLDAVYSSIDGALKPGRAIYICHADTEGHHFRSAFVAQPWKLQSCVIWKKTAMVFGRADYQWIHEPILYGWREGAPHVWAGDRKQTTVWEIPNDHQNKQGCDTDGYVHPTQKPVALIERAIQNSCDAGEIVLDLFGGSGSTLIACEKNTRRARLMELDPRFVDVIVARWQQYTGGEAILDGDGRAFSEIAKDREPDVAA